MSRATTPPRSTGPADIDSFYVSTDGARDLERPPAAGRHHVHVARWPADRPRAARPARLYHGQPVFITTGNGGHSWTVDPLPAGDGQIFKLSCPSAADCQGLASATGKPISPGFSGLMASVAVIGTTDGGRRFTAARFTAGHSLQDISCPTASYCVAVGVYDESVRSRSAPLNGFVMISRDGGVTLALGHAASGPQPRAVPAGLLPDDRRTAG